MIVEIAKDTYFINEFGMDAQYVVVGEKRALVIDTGAGFYDMKAMIEALTKLPYNVAITHGHPDHAGGRGQFDVVYMHPADIPALKNISYEQEVQYGRDHVEHGNRISRGLGLHFGKRKKVHQRA